MILFNYIHYKKHQGFTLLELIIVLALSSIILFGVFKGYSIFQRMADDYYQLISLQNVMREFTYESEKIKKKLGQFGCVSTDQLSYIHFSKNLKKETSQKFFLSKNKIERLSFLNQSDIQVKDILPKDIYKMMPPNSMVIYLMYLNFNKDLVLDKNNRVYSDCQDIFVLADQDPIDFFRDKPNFRYEGKLQIELYFVARNKRYNNKNHPIFSLYRYNELLGVQEVLEGVERIQSESNNSKKIQVLLNSVEGSPPVRQWITVGL